MGIPATWRKVFRAPTGNQRGKIVPSTSWCRAPLCSIPRARVYECESFLLQLSNACNLRRYRLESLAMTRLLILLLPALFAPIASIAADLEIPLVIKDHRFVPEEVKVLAGKKVKLVIDNQDSSSEEFESHEINREKVIPGNSKANVFIGPLNPGRYPFYGEFNEKTARGVVIAE